MRSDEAIRHDPRANHIAVLVHSLNDGGAQRRLVTLANGFAEAGRRVDFLYASNHGQVAQLLDPRVCPLWLGLSERGRRLPLHLGRLRGCGKLAEYLREQRPDVLMAGSTNVHLLAVAACAMLDESPALVLRASRHPRKRIARHRLLKRLWDGWRGVVGRWAYDQAERVIAVSHEVGAALAARMKQPQRCGAIANPVVTDEFRASLDAPLDHRWLDRAEPLLVAAGRLTTQKDFATLLRAMAEVVKRRPAHLLLFGEGPLRADLQARIGRLGLAEHAELMGSTDRLAAWLARADLVVSSSTYEGSPGVQIEAIAAGTPVVATRCPGGSAELVGSPAVGQLVEVRDWRAMACAILDQLERPRDRAALAAVAGRYDAADSVRAYLDTLDQGVAERAAARGPGQGRRRGMAAVPSLPGTINR